MFRTIETGRNRAEPPVNWRLGFDAVPYCFSSQDNKKNHNSLQINIIFNRYGRLRNLKKKVYESEFLGIQFFQIHNVGIHYYIYTAIHVIVYNVQKLQTYGNSTIKKLKLMPHLNIQCYLTTIVKHSMLLNYNCVFENRHQIKYLIEYLYKSTSHDFIYQIFQSPLFPHLLIFLHT